MLSRSKSYSMLITTNPMSTNAKLNIFIDGETVSALKYFGIDIDSKLNWNNHIDRLCRISPKIRLDFSRRLGQIVPSACLTKYYMATVQSHNDYFFYCLGIYSKLKTQSTSKVSKSCCTDNYK